MQVEGAGMSSASLTAKVILGCWEGLKLDHFGEGLQTLPPCFRCRRTEVCSSKSAHWLTGCPYPPCDMEIHATNFRGSPDKASWPVQTAWEGTCSRGTAAS